MVDLNLVEPQTRIFRSVVSRDVPGPQLCGQGLTALRFSVHRYFWVNDRKGDHFQESTRLRQESRSSAAPTWQTRNMPLCHVILMLIFQGGGGGFLSVNRRLKKATKNAQRPANPNPGDLPKIKKKKKKKYATLRPLPRKSPRIATITTPIHKQTYTFTKDKRESRSPVDCESISAGKASVREE